MTIFKRQNEKSLSDLVKELIHDPKIVNKYTSVRIEKAWEENFGAQISKHTHKLNYYQRILTIYLTSSVLRHELLLGKAKIIKTLNESLGEELIDDIYFK